MSAARQTRPEETAILLVDVQTSFVEAMAGSPEPVLLRLERLLGLAAMIGLPVIATRERPIAAKGGLHPRVASPSHAILDKSTFDAMAEPGIAASVTALGREHVVVAGCETDVCVLLTVLGLLRAGHRVTVLTDCLFSSEPDPSAAVRRMEAAGAAPGTFKTLAYELTATVDRSTWPDGWRERLAADPSLFPEPETLPPLA